MRTPRLVPRISDTNLQNFLQAMRDDIEILAKLQSVPEFSIITQRISSDVEFNVGKCKGAVIIDTGGGEITTQGFIPSNKGSTMVVSFAEARKYSCKILIIK